MTTLENKAYEYASQRYYELTQDQQNDFNHDEVERAFIAGYTEALRWRDVNEELPEEPYEVLVQSTRGKHAIATYTNMTGWVLQPNARGFGSVIKWRPIEII